MKNREKKGRLVLLLAKGFLGFTLAVLIVTALTFWFYEMYYERLTRVPDIEKMLADDALLSGRYKSVPVSKYLGKDGAFAVVDAEGTTIYQSNEIFQQAYTDSELECIQPYDSYSYVVYTSFDAQDEAHGDGREHLFIRYNYGDEGDMKEDVMILNDDYEVIGGSFQKGKDSYTDSEVAYLTGEAYPGADLLQIGLEGQRTLLMLSKCQDMAYYNELMKKSSLTFLAVIPLYVLVLVIFLFWISRRITKPLESLNHVIEMRAGGSNMRAGNLDGPWEIRRIGENFDHMIDRLEHSEKQRRQLDEDRQRMIAAISHDLKTPITAISGYTRAICDSKIPEGSLDNYLRRIDAKATELNKMINSFHEFSKTEHPDFSLQLKKEDICEFMRSYLAERYNDIEFHGFLLKAEIPDDLCIYSLVDREQLRRALDNILYNTLEHNSLGTVLAVQVSRVTQSAGSVSLARISFADNGIGIPPAMGDKIFEPFVMGDESRSGKGSGLGLSIARSIIRSHGGKLSLCSPEVGFSTEFEILLREVI